MPLPTIGGGLPRVIPAGSGELTRTDADDLYLPQDAPVVSARRSSLAVATDTITRTLFSLPAGAVLLGFVFDVREAFNDSGTDLVAIGDGVTADRFVAGQDVGAAGLTLVPSADIGPLAAATVLHGAYSGENTTFTAGAVTITVLYLAPGG